MCNDEITTNEENNVSVMDTIEQKRQEIERLRKVCDDLTLLLESKKKKFDEIRPLAIEQNTHINLLDDERYVLNDDLKNLRKDIRNTELRLNYLKSELTKKETKVKELRIKIPKLKKDANPIFVAYYKAKKELEDAEKMVSDIKDKIVIAENELLLLKKELEENKEKDFETVINTSPGNVITVHNLYPLAQKEKTNLWISGSFYALTLIALFTLLGVIASKVPWYTLLIVIVGGLLALSIVGANQLRNDEKIDESSFLQLMLEAIKKIPLIKWISKE